ncbi:hypothetical protein [Clostridium thermosuccinogenes]|uniref:hypothetical protein n=1 Tax=Clostridium thermosuccinogenes TaxID=84032 RepID=UPI000CCC3F8F|nr:hypothetical protein [Pseudoclostridium thermosuccinogenes]PNT94147.1 hypothetical protein CDQ83_11910 [Pseudoclostridium thermosuccinogenes]
MGKVLDLSMFLNETFDLILSKDDIINIKKPSEELAIKILAHRELSDKSVGKTSTDQFLRITRDITTAILNHNKNERVFDDKWVKDNIPIDIQFIIIQNYTEWMTQLVNKNPNL